jgi:type IX secretion system PorP/SprF family membrane protein
VLDLIFLSNNFFMCNFLSKYYRSFFISLVGFHFIQILNAQDIHLSQFFNTPLMRNPALAGVFTGDVRVQGVYRNQWQSLGYPYQTNALSLEYKFAVGQADDYMTIGAGAFYDQAGIMKLKTVQVMPAINFHKSLSGNRKSYLSGGLMAGFVNRQFEGKNLTFDNQYTAGRFDPSAASGERFSGLATSFFDIATGLSYNGQLGQEGAFYAGVSLWHFHKPSINFLSEEISLDPKWQFNAGVRQWVGENLELIAEANYLSQGAYTETIGGLMLLYDMTDQLNDTESELSQLSLGLGSYVRLKDAIIPYGQVRFNHLNIGLSYDINISPLKAASQGRGGFELSLGYQGFTRNHNPGLRGLRCPGF